jgi:flagellar basal-body rod protein FlgF
MDSTGYVTLTRQSGLLREFQVIANNIANAATTGYRQEGVVFAELLQDVPDGPSISMANAAGRMTSEQQGTLTKTGGTLDIAIQGDGFFLIETPNGERLTRAGNFALSSAGELVTLDGFRVLDAGSAPIFIPPDALDIGISPDGSLSSEGRALGQVGVFKPIEPMEVSREDGVKFHSPAGVEPDFKSRVMQGHLESSNVDPIGQVARMIEVQQAYQLGQKFLETEDERMRNALKSLFR